MTGAERGAAAADAAPAQEAPEILVPAWTGHMDPDRASAILRVAAPPAVVVDTSARLLKPGAGGDFKVNPDGTFDAIFHGTSGAAIAAVGHTLHGLANTTVDELHAGKGIHGATAVTGPLAVTTGTVKTEADPEASEADDDTPMFIRDTSIVDAELAADAATGAASGEGEDTPAGEAGGDVIDLAERVRLRERIGNGLRDTIRRQVTPRPGRPKRSREPVVIEPEPATAAVAVLTKDDTKPAEVDAKPGDIVVGNRTFPAAGRGSGKHGRRTWKELPPAQRKVHMAWYAAAFLVPSTIFTNITGVPIVSLTNPVASYHNLTKAGGELGTLAEKAWKHTIG